MIKGYKASYVVPQSNLIILLEEIARKSLKDTEESCMH